MADYKVVQADALLLGHLVATPTDFSLRLAGLNHGCRKVARAIMDLRATYFMVETGAIPIPANQCRIPLTDSPFDQRPPVRIKKILSLGPNAPAMGGITPSTPSQRKWTYKSITDREFMAAEMSAAADGSVVYYDLIRPASVPTLAIAPALLTAETPFIGAQCDPRRLFDANSIIDPIVADHIEVAVAFAMEVILRDFDDVQADRWGADGMQMRSELIQHLADATETTQAVGSALWDMGPW